MAALTLVLGISLFGRSRPAARPLTTLETAENVAQRALNLDSMKTRRGAPSFRVTAREALTFREGNRELHDVHVTLYGLGKDLTEVSAPMARSTEEGGGGWSFEQGVDVRGAHGWDLHVPEMTYRESVQELTSEGEVRFDRGDLRGSARGLRYFVQKRRLEFHSDVEMIADPATSGVARISADVAEVDRGESQITFRNHRVETRAGESLSGAVLVLELDPNGSAIRAMNASGGFVLTSPGGTPGAGLLGAGGRSLEGQTLAVTIPEGGRVESVVAAGAARMKVSAPDGGEDRSLSCQRLTVSFTDGAPSSILAEEEAVLVVPPSPGGARGGEMTLKAPAIHVRLNTPSGALQSGEASGGAEAADSVRRLFAPRITFDGSAGNWSLISDDSRPAARVEEEGRAISAARIDVHRVEGTLVARGAVKTMLPQGRQGGAAAAHAADSPGEESPGAAASFLDGAGPVHGVGESLTLLREGRVAKYRERVRIWQGEASLEATAVDLSDDAGTVEAHGAVVARARSKVKGSPGPRLMTISADDLSYARATNDAKFGGHVRALTEGSRVEADSIVAKGVQGGGIRELDALGAVRFQDGTRHGEGDRLDVFLAENRYVLSGRGRIVTIQDQSSQQFVKGVVLTYEGSTDRILVESETGGRTWITLKPRTAEGKKSGPEPPH